jgi:hypothetical protein
MSDDRYLSLKYYFLPKYYPASCKSVTKAPLNNQRQVFSHPSDRKPRAGPIPGPAAWAADPPQN